MWETSLHYPTRPQPTPTYAGLASHSPPIGQHRRPKVLDFPRTIRLHLPLYICAHSVGQACELMLDSRSGQRGQHDSR